MSEYVRLEDEAADVLRELIIRKVSQIKWVHLLAEIADAISPGIERYETTLGPEVTLMTLREEDPHGTEPTA